MRTETTKTCSTRSSALLHRFSDYVTNIGSVENKGNGARGSTRAHNVRAFRHPPGRQPVVQPHKVLDLGGDKEFFLDGVNGSLPTFRPAAIVRLASARGFLPATSGMEFFKMRRRSQRAVRLARRLGMKLLDINGRKQAASSPDFRTVRSTADDANILGTHSRSTRSGRTASRVARVLGELSPARRAGREVVESQPQGMEPPGSDVNTLRSTLNYWTPTNPRTR